jgi:hypothetical protein
MRMFGFILFSPRHAFQKGAIKEYFRLWMFVRYGVAAKSSIYNARNASPLYRVLAYGQCTNPNLSDASHALT